MLTKLDKSNYLRGLLILSRLDQEISDYEKKALIRIGKILGFDPHFCSDAIEELADNPYISDKIPSFSKSAIGIAFIDDALKLAFSDHNFHPNEIKWIRNIAKMNNIKKKYILERAKKYKEMSIEYLLNYNFKIEQLIVDDEESSMP